MAALSPRKGMTPRVGVTNTAFGSGWSTSPQTVGREGLPEGPAGGAGVEGSDAPMGRTMAYLMRGEVAESERSFNTYADSEW
eukprot:1194979-Prorocentrum_minimum.AAC.9